MGEVGQKAQPPGQPCQEGQADLRSRLRPDFGIFMWNFEIWTVDSGSNCKGLQIWGPEFTAPPQMGVPRERPWPGEVSVCL